jgi:hypothetical protein
MLGQIDFDVRGERPTLDHYRRGWAPSAAVGLAGMWISAAVSDASGERYFGLRGADDFIPGMTHTVTPICGFRHLKPTLEQEPPHLFDEYASNDWFEPLQYEETSDKITLSFDSGRFERDADGLHWYDAGGRWEIHGKTVSDIVLTHVPAQDGIDKEVYYRHELIKGRGVINGVEVEGYVHQDYGYGPPGSIYSELPFLGRLQSMWVSWLQENADGKLGGGCFWQGRSGMSSFGPGYVLKDGVTSVYKDISTSPAFHDNGKLSGLEIRAGDDTYKMAFNMAESPLHVIGQVTGTSFGAAPEKSWCYAEYTGEMMTPEIVAWSLLRYRLARGR